MKIKFNYWVALFFLTLVICASSCRKTNLVSEEKEYSINSIENKFFNENRNNEPLENALVSFIQRENNRLKFVDKTVNQIGYPRWDKISTIEEESTSFTNSLASTAKTYYVPFVRDSQYYVNAAMLIKIGTESDTTFTYIQDWEYKTLPNTNTSVNDKAEQFAVLLMKLNKNVFGYSKFYITDSTLFKDGPQKAAFVTLDSSVNNGNSNSYTYSCTIVTTTVLVSCGQNIITNNSNYSSIRAHCYSSSVSLFCDFPTGGSSSGGPNGGGGSTSGGPSGGGGSGPGSTGNGSTGGSSTGGNSNGGDNGNTGAGGYVPAQLPLNQNILYVINALGLVDDEWIWLKAHLSRATEIKNYLVQNNNSLEAKEIASLHLVKMMSDSQYLLFASTHNQDLQTCYYAYETELEDNLINPCFKSMINILDGKKHKSKIFELYKSIQEIPKFKIKFRYDEVNVLPNDESAHTIDQYEVVSTNAGNVVKSAKFTIQLNKSVLNGASKEYIANIILHEICHSIIKANHAKNQEPIGTQADEHKEMINGGYPLFIFNSLKELFPSANFEELKHLAIGGMSDILLSPTNVNTNIEYNDKLLLMFPAVAATTNSPATPVINVYQAYNSTNPDYKNHIKGTICN